MLNPEFKLLDPEMEQLHRLQTLTDHQDRNSLLTAINNDDLINKKQVLHSTLNQHGIISQNDLLNAFNQKMETSPNPLSLFGWPESIIRPLIGISEQPSVIMLGILDGEGIWSGVLIGISKGGLDFLTTYQWIWQDEPELVTQQSITGFEEYIHTIEKRFSRQALGLFIYLDEFKQWQDENYSVDTLNEFCRNQTASYKWL